MTKQTKLIEKAIDIIITRLERRWGFTVSSFQDSEAIESEMNKVLTDLVVLGEVTPIKNKVIDKTFEECDGYGSIQGMCTVTCEVCDGAGVIYK